MRLQRKLKVGHVRERRASEDIKGKNKKEDRKEDRDKLKGAAQSEMFKKENAHLSPHNRHLSLKHGFVKAFIRLKRKTVTCVCRCLDRCFSRMINVTVSISHREKKAHKREKVSCTLNIS